jgi:CopG family transcriptional regulator/antitoxin EndoAI
MLNIIWEALLIHIIEDVLRNLGGASVADLKKIAVCMPDTLLKEIDDMVCHESINRSEFIRNAMRFYITEMKRVDTIEKMKSGYLEMSEINLTLAEIGLTSDNETMIGYETRLAECE